MEELKSQPKVIFTAEEYLAFEENAATKHELHDGRLVDYENMTVDMAGGSLKHSLIATNVISLFKARVSGKRCLVLNSDLAVRIAKSVNYYYPDVSVVCGPPLFDPPEGQRILTNPQLIVEVGSATTAAFDRREKFYNYMRIDTLREYVLIDQEKPSVDTFYRQDNGVWAIGPSFEGLDAVATLRLEGGVTLPLRDIYADVEFAKPAGAATAAEPAVDAPPT